MKNKFFFIFIHSFLLASIDSIDIWDYAISDTIISIEEVHGDIEAVISVAGVRGDEAKLRILDYLWYRKKSRRELWNI